MFVSQKKYDALLEEHELLEKAHEKLLFDLLKLERELNELKKKNEPSYFG